jgi:hypothetical protein
VAATPFETDLTAGNAVIGSGPATATPASSTSGAYPWESKRDDTADLSEPTALSNGGNENGSRDDEALNSMIAEYFRK